MCYTYNMTDILINLLSFLIGYNLCYYIHHAKNQTALVPIRIKKNNRQWRKRNNNKYL